MATISAVSSTARTASAPQKKEVKKENNTSITFSEWWNGEKSLTSTLARKVGFDGFADWLEDKDKVCTDGKDDGKLSFGEGTKSFFKGLIGGIPKAIIKHPLITAGTIGLGAGIMALTGGAAAPLLWGLGALFTVGSAAVNVYKASTAKTDAEAKMALEGTGTAAQSAVLLGLTYNSTMLAASKAGVKTDGGILQTMKSSAEVSVQNAKGNYLTWKTGVIHANSNKLQGAHEYMSKANDAQAYRFNPNGTPEEILANNPGVFRGADGKYYLPNKWNPSEPYLIDPTKEQMIMLYGGDDMAVCDGAIFKGSYVDKTAFHADGTLNYQDPTKLQYGQIVDVTKQAPGGFKVMPEGTKIQTLEGVRVVGADEVVALDHAGNPYVTPYKNITARNVVLTQDGKAALPQYQRLWKLEEDLAFYRNQMNNATDYSKYGTYDQYLYRVNFTEEQIANLKKTYKISD